MIWTAGSVNGNYTKILVTMVQSIVRRQGKYLGLFPITTQIDEPDYSAQ